MSLSIEVFWCLSIMRRLSGIKKVYRHTQNTFYHPPYFRQSFNSHSQFLYLAFQHFSSSKNSTSLRTRRRRRWRKKSSLRNGFNCIKKNLLHIQQKLFACLHNYRPFCDIFLNDNRNNDDDNQWWWWRRGAIFQVNDMKNNQKCNSSKKRAKVMHTFKIHDC